MTPEHKALVDNLRETAIGFEHMIEYGLRDMCNEAAAALESLSAQGEAEAVGVKPLEWHGKGWPRVAKTVFGLYKIWAGKDVWFEGECLNEYTRDRDYSEDDAKAAAQADYEQRIRSCLVASPTPVPDAVDKQAAWLAEASHDALIEEAKDFTERMTSQPWACELIERLLDVLASNKPVGDGYVLVPKEPTGAMIDAVPVFSRCGRDWRQDAEATYRAMLAASGEAGR